MKKLIRLAILSVIIATCSTNSFALLNEDEDYEIKKSKVTKTITTIGYPDYPPFGEIDEEGRFTSVFDGFLEVFKNRNSIQMSFLMNKDNYNYRVQEVRAGNIDFIIGAYSGTNMYENINIIFPAAVVNPIHIVTLPTSTQEIKSIDDLKKLKCGISSKEYFNDFVNRQLQDFNIVKVDNSYELFEKLFKKEIDYILGSRYFLMIEASKIGLGSQIRFSKNAIWDMPMFLGVSKSNEYRDSIDKYIGKELKKPEVQEKINNYLIDMINNIEKENSGIVPPTFVNDDKIDK